VLEPNHACTITACTWLVSVACESSKPCCEGRNVTQMASPAPLRPIISEFCTPQPCTSRLVMLHEQMFALYYPGTALSCAMRACVALLTQP
jgi:hypothetical protein